MLYGKTIQTQLLKLIRESGGFRTFNAASHSIIILRHLQHLEEAGFIRRVDDAPPGHITYQLLDQAPPDLAANDET